MYQLETRLATAIASLLVAAAITAGWAAGCSATRGGGGAARATSATSGPRQAKANETLSPPQAARTAAGQGEGTSAVEQLAERIERLAREALGDSVDIDREWTLIDAVGWSGRPGARALALTFKNPEIETPLAVYYLVAWQPLFAPAGEQGEMPLYPPLLTVTERALVFGYPPASAGSDSAPGSVLHEAVCKAVQLERNQRDITDAREWALPEKLRVMSLEVHPHYAVVQAALPGSGLPNPKEVSRAFPARMVSLSLVPDRGRLIRQWIAPEKRAKRARSACPCQDRGQE